MRSTVERIKPAIKRVPGVHRLRCEIASGLMSARLLALKERYGDRYHEAVFTRYWAANTWGDAESRSGAGANLRQTAFLRDELAGLLEDLSIRRLLDIPCGDFHWMKAVQWPSGLSYVGGDIVEPMVKRNNDMYGGRNVSFRTIDVLRDALPEADLVLCRDCLVHFSFADVFTALRNLRQSRVKYLLTTHFAGQRDNSNIRTGRWQAISLTARPFGFPPPLRLIDERCTEGNGRYRDKCLGLWRLEDIPDFGREGGR
ncbi:MAG: class I SAM-dependent methyltransferase [Bryobacteraceae bacterium]